MFVRELLIDWGILCDHKKTNMNDVTWSKVLEVLSPYIRKITVSVVAFVFICYNKFQPYPPFHPPTNNLQFIKY